jgi:hypothetical protein
MMEKLMVDSVVTWATNTRGRLPLRPDGASMISNMQAVRSALDA